MLKLYINNNESGFMPLSNYHIDLLSINYDYPVYNFEAYAPVIELDENDLVTYLKPYKHETITHLQIIDDVTNQVLFDKDLDNGTLIVCTAFTGTEEDGNFITRYSLTIEDRIGQIDNQIPVIGENVVPTVS